MNFYIYKPINYFFPSFTVFPFLLLNCGFFLHVKLKLISPFLLITLFLDMPIDSFSYCVSDIFFFLRVFL